MVEIATASSQIAPEVHPSTASVARDPKGSIPTDLTPNNESESLRASLVDEITKRLRRSILSGEIGPRERIRVRDVQNRFGVSHIPIREALRHLEAESLVESVPQRGVTATPISLGQLDDLYDFRRLLECAVAERAIRRFTPERIQSIEQCLEQLESASGDPNSDTFFEAHRRFHWAILEPGATSLIGRTLFQLWQMSERYVRLSIRAARTDLIAAPQHRHLYEACVAGDVDRLKNEIVEHLQVTENAIRTWYEADQLEATNGIDRRKTSAPRQETGKGHD